MMNTAIGISSRRPAPRTLPAIPKRRKISMLRAMHRSIFPRNSGASFSAVKGEGLGGEARAGPGSRLEGEDGIADRAKSRKSQEPRQAGRAREPHANRQSAPLHLRRPPEDRLRLEAELRHDLQI